MYRFGMMISAVCIALSAMTSFAEMREFTKKDGEAVYGEILDYNPKTDKVKIKTDRKGVVMLKAEDFRDEDFMYIRDWDAVRLFSQNTHFRVYLDGPHSLNEWSKKLWYRPPGKSEASWTHKVDFERVGFTIKYENQTGYDLENMKVKYCIFYLQEKIDYTVEEKVEHVMVRPSVHEYPIVPNGKNTKMQSNTIVLRDTERNYTSGGSILEYLEGDGKYQKGEIVGMIVRAEIETLSGQKAVREIRLPKDLSEEYVWVEPTEENTVWPDDDLIEKSDLNQPPTMWEENGGGSEE